MTARLRELFQVSLEEAVANGSKVQEIEYCFFVKIDDFKQLEEATSYEVQEQWELFVDRGDLGFGTLRVRSIDDRRWVMCGKLKKPGVLGKEEVEVVTTKDMFEHFKFMASTGLRKVRYNFPLEGTKLVYEIDVFFNAEGQPLPWVKVDLEVPAPLDEIPQLPIRYSEGLFEQPAQRTPEQAAFVRDLFDNHYNLAVRPGVMKA